MSLMQFLRILVARKWMVLGTFLACVGVATSIALLLPKRYPASARVLLDIARPDPITGQSISANAMRGYVMTQIQLLKDMRVAGAVVDQLGLANDPRTIAAYEATGRTEADGGIRAWIGQSIIDRTNADIVMGSNILEIRYEAANQEQAKQVVGALRNAYINESLRFRTDAAGRGSDWFREQATTLQAQLRAAEQRLSTFMQENDVVIVGGADSDIVKLQSLQAAVQQARGAQTANETMSAGRLANDPVADQLQLQLATIEDELALAGARLGPEHPTYKAIEARRNTLRQALGQAQSKSRAGVAAVTGASRRSLAQLEAELAAQEAKVVARKPIIDQLVNLNREVTVLREQYDKILARGADLRLEADVSETGLVVLGDATASSTPSYPRIPLIVGLSAFFGLALGVLAALVTEFLARRVRGPEDLGYAIGAPVLVTVGSPETSPLRLRMQRLLGRRQDLDDNQEMQAI
jgi:uncharacterized protein involved in exopolysaccharide biosynthesis